MQTLSALLAGTFAAFGMVGVSLVLSQSLADFETGSLVLVVAPPWGQGPSAVIRRAGLNESYLLSAPMGSLAQLTTPDDAQRLKDHGAWLILDGTRIAELCNQ